MKLRLLTLMLMTFLYSFSAMATQPITFLSKASTSSFDISKHNSNVNAFGKIKNWYKKKITNAKIWVTKKLVALDFDFDDPKSVLKLSLIALLGGIIFYILGAWVLTPLYYIGHLLWATGAALFFYWLILKLLE